MEDRPKLRTQQQQSWWHRSTAAWPAGLTIYTLVLVAVAFGSSVRGLPWWYQLLVAIATVLMVGCLWLTNLTDPGVIPPKAHRDPVIDLLEGGHELAEYTKDAKGRWIRMGVDANGYPEVEKFCMACNVWRQRGYHCQQCQFCMERGDHHCGVMGNCVALRNHRFFAGMLCCGWAGCMLMLGGCIWRLNTGNKWEEGESYFLAIMAVVYGYHAVMLIFGLFHAASLICDFTTKDLAAEDGSCGNNVPCGTGKRNPAALVRAWSVLCCGPVAWRPMPAPLSSTEPLVGDGVSEEEAVVGEAAHRAWATGRATLRTPS